MTHSSDQQWQHSSIINIPAGLQEKTQFDAFIFTVWVTWHLTVIISPIISKLKSAITTLKQPYILQFVCFGLHVLFSRFYTRPNSVWSPQHKLKALKANFPAHTIKLALKKLSPDSFHQTSTGRVHKTN